MKTAEAIRIYRREWKRQDRFKNPEKYRAKERAYISARREKYRAKGRAQYAKHREKRKQEVKEDRLLRLYSLTPEGVEKIKLAQGNKCAICKKTLVNPCIDHCHKTGRVRGILCNPCNFHLSALETPGWLSTALTYLNPT